MACAPTCQVQPPALNKSTAGAKLVVKSRKRRFIQCSHVGKRDKRSRTPSLPSPQSVFWVLMGERDFNRNQEIHRTKQPPKCDDLSITVSTPSLSSRVVCPSETLPQTSSSPDVQSFSYFPSLQEIPGGNTRFFGFILPTL